MIVRACGGREANSSEIFKGETKINNSMEEGEKWKFFAILCEIIFMTFHFPH